jgi:hypothetical protein
MIMGAALIARRADELKPPAAYRTTGTQYGAAAQARTIMEAFEHLRLQRPGLARARETGISDLDASADFIGGNFGSWRTAEVSSLGVFMSDNETWAATGAGGFSTETSLSTSERAD